MYIVKCFFNLASKYKLTALCAKGQRKYSFIFYLRNVIVKCFKVNTKNILIYRTGWTGWIILKRHYQVDRFKEVQTEGGRTGAIYGVQLKL
jgi:hypothetical protein